MGWWWMVEGEVSLTYTHTEHTHKEVLGCVSRH